ncbi:hypothetical protein GGH13_001592 [Coemansia sp. S155-1]|nr:hypothetical protein GGH13_001592 [Coemansia sp. S155-1]
MSCVICCESLFDNIYELSESHGAPSGNSSHGDRANHDWTDRPSVLTCGHVFHQGCISAWLAQSNRGTCPTCRTKHTGDAIAMYFDKDTKDNTQITTNSSPQVEKRNKIIKTLCANIESALAEVKAANLQLDEANARFTAKEQEHANEVQNVRMMKNRASLFKKSAHELKTLNMKLEATVAEQARQIEDLRSANATLGAELDEQKRVVEAMGDVRGTNEKLVRALKAERTRAETQNAVNKTLASRINALEKTSLPLVETGGTAAVSDDSSAATSQGISQIDLTENASGIDSENLEEDTAAVSRSIAFSRREPKKAMVATARRTAKFELPVAAFDNAESGADAKHNPFAAPPIQAMKFESPSLAFFVPPGRNELLTRDPQVTSSKQIQGRHIRAIRKPTANLTALSDGMGGSAQYGGFGSKRPTSSVQSKINWGPKR